MAEMSSYVMIFFIPVMMIFFGVLWRKHFPKKINLIYGYRSTWSMKTKETWDFAHQYFAKYWLLFGLIAAVLAVVVVIISNGRGEDFQGKAYLITLIIQLVAFISPLIQTEIKLRKTFDKNGNER